MDEHESDEGSEDAVKNMLEAYGPWTPNDKLLLQYYFGNDEKEASLEFKEPTVIQELTQGHKQAAKAHSLAFVFMVHSEFEGRLPTLLNAVYSKQHTYMIHVDSGVSDASWQWAQKFVEDINSQHHASNVHLVRDRFRGAWGSISLVYQELGSIIELFRLVRDGKANQFSHVINLSAFDFPVKSLSRLESFLKHNLDVNFIEVLPPDLRREERQLNLHMPCNRSLLAANISENMVCPAGTFNWMFKHNPDWKYGEGSQWHFLTSAYAQYLITNLDVLELLFSFKYTLVPDEAFFQSALLNSPFASALCNYNYRFLPWADGLEVSLKHIPLLRETDAFFARKLIDATLADVLTRELLHK